MNAKQFFSLYIFGSMFLSCIAMNEYSSHYQIASTNCSIEALPLEIIGNMLCLYIDNLERDFRIGPLNSGPQEVRKFLVTCKKYYDNEKLVDIIIKRFSANYSKRMFKQQEPWSPIWISLHLNTPPSKQWLSNWIKIGPKHMKLAEDALKLRTLPPLNNKAEDTEHYYYNANLIIQLLKIGVPKTAIQPALIQAKDVKNHTMEYFLDFISRSKPDDFNIPAYPNISSQN